MILCSGNCEHGKFMGECLDCARAEIETEEAGSYGGGVEVVHSESWRVVHTGDPLHDTVPVGEQCRCGWINFGVVTSE